MTNRLLDPNIKMGDMTFEEKDEFTDIVLDANTKSMWALAVTKGFEVLEVPDFVKANGQYLEPTDD